MPALIVRFPDGTREFRYPDRPLEVGHAILHVGVRYHVTSVFVDAEGDQVTVTVERESLGDLLRSEEGAARVLAAVDQTDHAAPFSVSAIASQSRGRQR